MADAFQDNKSSNLNSRSTTYSVDRLSLWKLFFGSVGGIFLVWSALQVIWVRRLLDPLYGSIDHPLGIFSYLFSDDWSFSFTNTPPLILIQSIVVIIFTTLLGGLCLRILDAHLTRRAFWCLSFLIGFGVSGLAFEILIIAKGLYFVTSWLLWAALFGIAFWVFRIRDVRPIWRFWRSSSRDHYPAYEFLDDPQKLDRGRMERIGPRHETRYTESLTANFIGYIFLVIAIVLCGLTFWHALFYPETYWDSLILYLGYARMTFVEHKFPIKIVGQVGIGLGANYPHIFSNYGAMASTMFGSWSDLYQRMLPPIFQVISAVLIYDLIVMMLGRRFVAMGAVVIFLSVPYGIAYYTFASNYSLAMAITAAFLYLAAVLARTKLPGIFVLFTFIPAIAMHINYLMGVLWVPWVVVCLFAFFRYRSSNIAIMREIHELPEEPVSISTERFPSIEAEATGTEIDDSPERAISLEFSSPDAPSPLGLLANKIFWIAFGVSLALGSTWYVRNTLLTGNPVYAFFPEIFTASKNINPEVMESAQLEWYANGDGLNQAAQLYAQLRFSENGQDPESVTPLDVTLKDRIKASHLFFQGYETVRYDEDDQQVLGSLIDRLYFLQLVSVPIKSEGNMIDEETEMPMNSHAYKLAPLFLGFFLPGALIGFLILLFPKGSMLSDFQALHRGTFITVYFGSLTVFACFMGYHYVLSDMYLYQMIPVIIPMGIIASLALLMGTAFKKTWGVIATGAVSLLVFGTAFFSGLPFALTNFKFFGTANVGRNTYVIPELDVFRNPGLDPSAAYRIRYGADAVMWEDINARLGAEQLLTHDNRHLMYDPDITIVHLDDWSIQQLYDLPLEEKASYFFDRGINYYLEIPNEFEHPVNERLEMETLIDNGYFRLLEFWGGNKLYELHYPPAKNEEREGTVEILEPSNFGSDQ